LEAEGRGGGDIGKESSLQDEASGLLLGGLGLGLDVVLLADLTDEGKETLLDVDAGLRRRLQIRAIERLGQIASLRLGHLTLGLQIAFVAADHNGDLVGILDTKNLISEGRDFVERGSGRDGKHAQETLTRAHVLVTHGRVFLLSGSIEDVEQAGLVVDGHLLAIAVFDGGIVFIDEVILDELDSEGRFSDSASSDDDEFVFGGHFCVFAFVGFWVEAG